MNILREVNDRMIVFFIYMIIGSFSLAFCVGALLFLAMCISEIIKIIGG